MSFNAEKFYNDLDEYYGRYDNDATERFMLDTLESVKGDYRAETFDTATGMANAMHFVRSDGAEIVVGTNREIDEVAYYEFAE